MEYKGILRERKSWVKALILILAAYMFYLEFRAGQMTYVIISALVILACFFKKEHVISEEGVDIKYLLFGMTMHNYWKWEEITTLHTDYKKAKPNVMLHIGKDISVRSFVMDKADCQGAIALARRMNPDIYIENPTEEEQERREQEILHRQKVLRAQKSEQRRKKQK